MSRRFTIRVSRTFWPVLAFACLFASVHIANAASLRRAQAAARAQVPTPRVITDETGRHMMIPANVHRIVSLAPNLTETLYALGAADLLVADSDACDTPPQAKSKPHVGSPKNPSLEAIVALHPDLVLASTSINNAQSADALLRAGIPVYTSDPHTVLGILASIAQLGDLIGMKSQSDALAADLRARLDALHARLADRPPVHVLFLVWFTPPMSIGSNTFIADALRWAGAESILTTSQSWPQPSFEELLRIQPDYIVLTSDHAGGSSDLAALRANADWRGLAAVQYGRVLGIGDDFDRPSAHLVDAIESLARQLHPEVFGNCAAQPVEASACAH